MKYFFQIALFLSPLFAATNLQSQNTMINVLTRNGGIVKKGEIIFFEVTITNTSPTKSLQKYKIRPQISFPTSLVSIPETGHLLPEGWTISINENGVVLLSNGTDIIPENTKRMILIAMKGESNGGPATIIGNLLFSNGIAPGTVSGAPTKEDNVADNSSTSSVKVL